MANPKAGTKGKEARHREQYRKAFEAYRRDPTNREKELAFFKIDPPPPSRRGRG